MTSWTAMRTRLSLAVGQRAVAQEVKRCSVASNLRQQQELHFESIEPPRPAKAHFLVALGPDSKRQQQNEPIERLVSLPFSYTEHIKMSGRYAFAKGLKEVRFLFCQTGEHSAATRSFLSRAYPIMKKNNPSTPIMLREAQGTLPKIYARYGLGQEKSQSLEGLSDKQIEDAVTQLVKNETS
ncbi:hypothetical protein QC762_114540 [Podospora pseudocomata]|uniref:Ribosomal protein/NADH dehydrogenase domain-containing protein n=2 Tax=Podospora TaxID=5144 RepID=A0ABR0GW87_9PEZI|nr:hypothetical protein QC761_114540 [Podospora bellae-mahoneyi]KAK4659914.1 hypothetical protein QC762_114540 [Podospora pseudocomata]